jgi:phosphoribosylformimino-5-aminoimidazole carboxamide ribotide isomerase
MSKFLPDPYIRTMDDVKFYIENGVSRVILGTAAINDPVFLKEALSAYGDKIAVGLDCKDGYACASGWLEKSDLHYLSFAAELVRMGVRNIIFTDISRDGTLHGPNLEMLKELQAHADCDITASGGISSLDDIRKLNDLGLYGAITGKAIYSGALPLAEAVRICRRDA